MVQIEDRTFLTGNISFMIDDPFILVIIELDQGRVHGKILVAVFVDPVSLNDDAGKLVDRTGISYIELLIIGFARLKLIIGQDHLRTAGDPVGRNLITL